MCGSGPITICRFQGDKISEAFVNWDALGLMQQLGAVTLPGKELRKRLGMRSTWFSIGVLSLSPPTIAVVYGSRAPLTGLARGLPGRVNRRQLA